MAHALSWVIAGGESGPKARPSHPAWFRALRDQCFASNVPFFFKQWGQWAPMAAAELASMAGTIAARLPERKEAKCYCFARDLIIEAIADRRDGSRILK